MQVSLRYISVFIPYPISTSKDFQTGYGRIDLILHYGNAAGVIVVASVSCLPDTVSEPVVRYDKLGNDFVEFGVDFGTCIIFRFRLVACSFARNERQDTDAERICDLLQYIEFGIYSICFPFTYYGTVLS